MRLGAPIHLPRRPDAPPPGLHLGPRDALPQLGGGGEWVHVTLASPEPDGPARWAERLRALYVSVVTERDQVPTVARVVGADALLGEPARRGDAWAVDLSFDLADLMALPAEPYHLHLASEHLRSAAQRREAPTAALAAPDPAALVAPLDRLVAAYSLARGGDDVGALHLFAAAAEGPGGDPDVGRPHAFNAACASARLAAQHGLRADLVAHALAWLDEDLRRSEALLLGVWRALARATGGPERRRLQRRRDALAAHLDARADDPDLGALRGTDAWRARADGA